MEIDKEKCDNWINKTMELIMLTKEINNKEAKYIKSIILIALGNVELQEIEKDCCEKEKIKNV